MLPNLVFATEESEQHLTARCGELAMEFFLVGSVRRVRALAECVTIM